MLGILSGAVLSGAGGHMVGTPPPSAAVIPFFGWSLSVPGFALLAATLRPAAAPRAVDAFALGYACVTTLALVAALNARPLFGIGL